MANLRKVLEDAVVLYGEPIEAIVVGHHDSVSSTNPTLIDENIILSSNDGLTKVDQDYDNGYGAPDCFPLYAWTKSRVFFVYEYDGSTDVNWVPRHPIAIEPQFSGQSD